MVKYCKKCGKECLDEAKFCQKCGYKFDDNNFNRQNNNLNNLISQLGDLNNDYLKNKELFFTNIASIYDNFVENPNSILSTVNQFNNNFYSYLDELFNSLELFIYQSKYCLENIKNFHDTDYLLLFAAIGNILGLKYELNYDIMILNTQNNNLNEKYLELFNEDEKLTEFNNYYNSFIYKSNDMINIIEEIENKVKNIKNTQTSLIFCLFTETYQFDMEINIKFYEIFCDCEDFDNLIQIPLYNWESIYKDMLSNNSDVEDFSFYYFIHNILIERLDNQNWVVKYFNIVQLLAELVNNYGFDEIENCKSGFKDNYLKQAKSIIDLLKIHENNVKVFEEQIMNYSSNDEGKIDFINFLSVYHQKIIDIIIDYEKFSDN